jgi:electron transport complex protein RnfB
MNLLSVVLNIVFSLLVLSGLGIFSGLVIGLVTGIFRDGKNERNALIERAAPGLNCGVCGYAGCSSYTDETGCGNGEITKSNTEKNVTQVHCGGGLHTADYRFQYKGIKDCNAAFEYFGGEKSCKSGCLAFGSCIKVCPEDAIQYDKNGLVRVNKERCTGCDKCVSVCPTGVMKSIPYFADVYIACNSKDSVDLKKKFCSVSCIACSICEQQPPDSGFAIIDNLAQIDYSKSGNRINAKQKCPTSCITPSNIIPNQVQEESTSTIF